MQEENEFEEILNQFYDQTFVNCILPLDNNSDFGGIYSGSIMIFLIFVCLSLLSFGIYQYYERKHKLTIRSEGHFQRSESNPIDMKEYNSLIAFEHIIKNYGYKFHQRIEDNKILFESNKESVKNIRKQVEDMIKLVRIKKNNSIKSRAESPKSERGKSNSPGIPWKNRSLLQN